ncbi:MAG TPA: hypothetical protein VEK11_19165 [Thermoanaerobaculia bacterium]|nr:hypothetical protein [Thermoanaerobaculia bacterium]
MKRLLAALFLCGAASAVAMPTPVSDLPVSCTFNSGSACSKTYDSTSGVCRTVRFATSAGEIQLLVCDKTDHYELYRQSYPANITFKACAGGGSVDQLAGFSSFTSTTLGSGCGAPLPPGDDDATALVNPSSTGFANETRAANHARLLDVWWNNGNVIQHFACSYGTCAWVPWYSVSHSCNLGELKPLSDCGGSGSATLQDNCMVTDEFSQVFLATAQGTNASRVQELFNTLRLLASGNNGGLFETLPAWRARRTNTTVSVASSGANRDSASDADARILLALSIAAASPYFPETERTAYRNYANAMAADFLQHDFRRECRTGRNGVQICDWLASGGNAANGQLDYDFFTYAGYFGDATIALLAAYKALGQSSYLDAARDTVNAYLLASDFTTSFRVPAKSFRWDTSVSPPRSACSPGSCTGAWDDSDAPRATSICKATYYASLLGVSLPGDLDAYCTAWRNRGGLTSNTYKMQYAFDGTPQGTFQDGPYENGLAASLDFAYAAGDLGTRLDRVGTKWDAANNRWYGQTCVGVYRNAFFTTNLGSAIGRDLNVWK